MAHFARIDSNNVVIRVHVLKNEVLMKDGEENEQQGMEFLQSLHKTTDRFIQTSYNGNFRKQFAGKGFTYDVVKDKFIEPQLYPSWSLDASDDWQPPVAHPDDGKNYTWNEDTTNWVEI